MGSCVNDNYFIKKRLGCPLGWQSDETIFPPPGVIARFSINRYRDEAIFNNLKRLLHSHRKSINPARNDTSVRNYTSSTRLRAITCFDKYPFDDQL